MLSEHSFYVLFIIVVIIAKVMLEVEEIPENPRLTVKHDANTCISIIWEIEAEKY